MIYDFFISNVYPVVFSKTSICTLCCGVLIIAFKGYGYYCTLQSKIDLDKARLLSKSQETYIDRMDEIMEQVDFCKSIDAKCNRLITRIDKLNERVNGLASDSKVIREYIEVFPSTEEYDKINSRVGAMEEFMVSMDETVDNLVQSVNKANEIIVSSPVGLKIRLDGYTFYNPDGSVITSGQFKDSTRDAFMSSYDKFNENLIKRTISGDSSAGAIPTDTHGDITMACLFGETLDSSSLLMHVYYVLPFVLVIIVCVLFLHKCFRR